MVYKLIQPYHTQRNNAIDPHATCQVTAAIMALRASGIPFIHPRDTQPEDHLAQILNSPEAHEKLRKEYPHFASRPPREVHAILSWGINKLAGKQVSIFTTRATTKELLFRIAVHKAASCLSGRWTSYGHVVTLVGFESDQADLDLAHFPDFIDLSKVSRIIIDDPYGDGKTGYRDPDGDDVSYTLEEFNQLSRDYGEHGRKWAHLFDIDGRF